MRVAVIVCGANGERSMIIERAVEEFAKKYFDRIIQFSACTVAVSPIIVQMSGGESSHLVAVNGCKNRCADLILKKAEMTPKVSLVLDDAVGRELAKCQNCARFDFPDIKEEEWRTFAEMMGKAVEAAQ